MKRKIIAALFAAFATLSCVAQNTINPATQVRWPAVTGSGAPTSPTWVCSSANYGQPYTDTLNNNQYVCTTSGWLLLTISYGTVAALTMNNGGSGAASGTTFNGSVARTLSYNTLGAAGLAASNSFTGTVNDFSNTTQFKLPVVAGYASAANGEVGYDSTNHNWHAYDNAVDNFLALFPVASPPTSGHLTGFLKTGNVWTLEDLGSPAGLAVAFSSLASGTNTGMAAVCGSGCSIGFTGTGTVTPSNVTGLVEGDGATITTTGGGTVSSPYVFTAIGSAATSVTVGTTTIGSGTAKGLLYDNAGVLGNLATGNYGVLVTSSAGVPSISSTLPTGLTAPSFTVTTAFTATGLVTNGDLANSAITLNGTAMSLGSSYTVGAAPTGTAGGDLSGSYPNPTVAQVNGGALPTDTDLVKSTSGGALVSSGIAPGNVFLLNASNTVGSGNTATQDFSGSEFIKVPVWAGCATTASGQTCHDSTSHNWHDFDNGVDNFVALIPSASPPTNGHLTTWSVSGGVVLLHDGGAPVVAPVGANPTATATGVAIDGTATTFMRSDAAPAINTAASGTLGLSSPDNTTIKATTGVFAVQYPTSGDLMLSAGNGAVPTAYAGTSSAGNVLTALSAAGAGSFQAYGLTGNSVLAETTTGGLLTPSILPLATSSAFGAVKVDGTTITSTAGVITAIGAAATSITVGTTTVGSGTNGDIEYNNGGVLGEKGVTGSGSVVLATSPSVSGLTVTSSFTATGLVTNGDLANSTISGISLGSNLDTLTFGTHLTSGGSSYNGSAGVTITSDATNANTASTIVARDGSGNFSAGTITATLSGNATNITASSNTSLTSLANLTTIGTIGTGVWNGTRLTSSYIPTDVAYYDANNPWSVTQNFTALTASTSGVFGGTTGFLLSGTVLTSNGNVGLQTSAAATSSAAANSFVAQFYDSYWNSGSGAVTTLAGGIYSAATANNVSTSPVMRTTIQAAASGGGLVDVASFLGSGYVGIGTNAPAYPLVVSSNTGGPLELLNQINTGDYAALGFTTNGGSWNISEDNNGAALYFSTGLTLGSNRLMTILSNNDVLIGTTTDSGSALTVAKDSAYNSTSQLLLTGKTTPAEELTLLYDNTNDLGFIQSSHTGVGLTALVLNGSCVTLGSLVCPGGGVALVAGGSVSGIGFQPSNYVSRGRTTNLSSTTILTTTATSTYLISQAISCDAAATATVSMAVTFTDPSGTAQTLTSGTAVCTTLGASSFSGQTLSVNVKTGTSISVSATILSGSPTFDVVATVNQVTSN